MTVPPEERIKRLADQNPVWRLLAWMNQLKFLIALVSGLTVGWIWLRTLRSDVYNLQAQTTTLSVRQTVSDSLRQRDRQRTEDVLDIMRAYVRKDCAKDARGMESAGFDCSSTRLSVPRLVTP